MEDPTHSAAKTARDFQKLMEKASFGASNGQSARDCESRASAAMKVHCYLTNSGYWGGPPPTREEALKHAKRAWLDDIPEEVASALSQ